MSPRSKSRLVRASIERLESRQLLSVSPTPILNQLNNEVVTSIPSNGDVNPYGITFVPKVFPTNGNLLPGDVIEANFNDSNNVQGTGTTITRVKADGTPTTFFAGPAGIGLDGGIAVLSRGYVLVGNEPSVGQTGVPATNGSSILVINQYGQEVANLHSNTFLNGPWDFTAVEQNNGATAVLFVSNALGGTVDRVTLSVPTQGSNVHITSEVQIGSGFTHGPNPDAFIIGPAGSAYDAANGKLYLNDEGDNQVRSISNALTTNADHGIGTLVYQDNTNLHGPLGMILAGNGHLIIASADSVNGDDNHPSELTEITTSGKLVATYTVDPSQGGAFDIAESFTGGVHRFAYVDDVTSTITVWKLHGSSAAALLPQLNNQTVSTIPSNGDVNPYGLAFVPDNFATGGSISPGDLLTANFNDSNNVQGTGTTITRVAKGGATSTFFAGPSGLGLDGGLSVLSRGFVLVGNEPGIGQTGVPATTGSSILILDKNGNQVGTLSSNAFLDGPWAFQTIEQNNGATVVLFVSNALSGTVSRLTLSVPSSGNNIKVTSEVQIGSGYIHAPNAAAFIVGPAGVAYDAANGNLYVAAEGNNAIFAIPNAMTTMSDKGKGKVVYDYNHDLHGPFGLLLASNGDLIIANADGVNSSDRSPSELTEITPTGQFLASRFIDASTGGAFEIAESFTLGLHRFAYVDDVTSTVTIWTLGG